MSCGSARWAAKVRQDGQSTSAPSYGAVCGLPYARLARLEALYTAVLAVIPSWWPGRIACMEISLATALTGCQARWVLGARFLPDAAHAWAEAPDGAVGRDIGDAVDRPWMPVLSVP
ncbi:lasso peptide biosynthesis protein [Streptomyces sp. CG1]|uniref:lasso peptide biosynthesis protein n=1 Tax=Streptomyces sp. CG1 TaxID=1287523 RepID=UPI0034E2F209